MVADSPITDDEIILRHIPGGPAFQQPPGPRITSANFRLRPGETGVSVSHAAITSPGLLFTIVGGDLAAGSKLAAALVSDIQALGLVVVPCRTDDDDGHAEIRSAATDLNKRSVARALAQLFQVVPVP